MKKAISILSIFLLLGFFQTAAFAGTVEICNVSRQVVAKTITRDMAELGIKTLRSDNYLLVFTAAADNPFIVNSGKRSTESRKPEISFRLVQLGQNIKVSADPENVMLESYLDELKARFNGRWTFGLVTDPRKEAYFEISSIILNSSAAKQGLKKGDRIVRINGNSVFDFDQDLNEYLKKAAKKTRLVLEVETGSRKRTVTLEKSFIPGSLEHLQTKH